MPSASGMSSEAAHSDFEQVFVIVARDSSSAPISLDCHFFNGAPDSRPVSPHPGSPPSSSADIYWMLMWAWFSYLLSSPKIPLLFWLPCPYPKKCRLNQFIIFLRTWTQLEPGFIFVSHTSVCFLFKECVSKDTVNRILSDACDLVKRTQ